MMMKKLLMAGVASALLATTMTSTTIAGTLDDIIARGKLVVGVKADYAPWGMRDASGKLVGMEHDMLADFAKRLGEKAGKTIELEKVVVVASNRMQFLEQGKIDMFIATMSNKKKRRKVVGIVQPDYYSSGVAVLAHKDSGISSWESLKGKKICGIQGAWYNKDHGLKNGADIIAFKGVSEVEKAILDGRCVGWVYDDSAFIPRKVNSPEKWKDFSIATPVVANVPWGAAVRVADREEPLGKALSAAIIDWHKSGLLVELEKKWGVPATAWLADMHEQCKAGAKICNDKYDDGESY
ncbi:MAG: transporter substrate-binding domain-containing protein [Hyphomicrobiales bacterium]|nr:transporter substrate-binding domain-containing protein [Hyphomicrobiales bacterium]